MTLSGLNKSGKSDQSHIFSLFGTAIGIFSQKSNTAQHSGI